MKREEVIAYARTMLHTPHKHLGRTPGIELDCVGLIAATADHFDQPYQDMKGYAPTPDGTTIIEQFDKHMPRVDLEHVQPGDVLVFWFRRPSLPKHCGFLTSPTTFIHTYSSAIGGKRQVLPDLAANSGRVVEQRLTEWWSKRLFCAYLFPGVE